jgi:succinyl-CoA:acetate CoA-transferase
MNDDIPDEAIANGLSVITADEAAGHVDREAIVLVSGFGGVGYPKRVPEALAADDCDRSLSVLSGGGVGGEIDDALVEADQLARRYPFQTRDTSREAINARRIAFHDRHISRFGDEVRLGDFGHPDIAIIEAVAVGDSWLVPSTSIGHTPSFIAAADSLIVEINRSQPPELARIHDIYQRDLPPERDPIPITDPTERIGSSRVTFDSDKLVGVVETERPDDPYEFRDPTDVDRQIADHLGSFLEAELDRNRTLTDRICLQFGVGSLGNALMGRLTDIDFDGREVVYFGEVFQDGLLDALNDGLLAGASATSLALSTEGQERLFADIEQYAEDVVLRPADVSNNPALIEQFGVVGVNSAVAVDLYGNANATHIGGSDLISGIGGSGDFNRNCRVGIIALPSTAGGGDISRIVPLVTHPDHTEHDHSVVVTEYGVADLRGKSPIERMESLIEVAHPEFRGPLQSYYDRALDDGRHIPFDPETAFSWLD